MQGALRTDSLHVLLHHSIRAIFFFFLVTLPTLTNMRIDPHISRENRPGCVLPAAAFRMCCVMHNGAHADVSENMQLFAEIERKRRL